MKSKALFLCTGNYYRSRFAELLFNHLAAAGNLAWEADSRGIATDLGWRNVGPISLHAQAALQALNVAVPLPIRFPRSLEVSELEAANLIIAVKESEHRALLGDRFPLWIERVEYWHVDDVDVAEPSVALKLLAEKVHELVKRLSVPRS